MPEKRNGHPALLILDMLSDFNFPNAAPHLRAAVRIAPAIAKLTAKARAANVPVIYVNDTSGLWESDQRAFVQRCLDGKGAAAAKLLLPETSDYFIFKPRHSAFYGTPLAEILYARNVRRLVLTGMSSHQCVLLTASDAHVRNLEVTVVTDCIAAATAIATRHATYILEHGLGAQLRKSANLRLASRN